MRKVSIKCTVNISLHTNTTYIIMQPLVIWKFYNAALGWQEVARAWTREISVFHFMGPFANLFFLGGGRVRAEVIINCRGVGWGGHRPRSGGGFDPTHLLKPT